MYIQKLIGSVQLNFVKIIIRSIQNNTHLHAFLVFHVINFSKFKFKYTFIN